MTSLLVLSNAAAGGTESEAVDSALAILRTSAEVEHAESNSRAELDALLNRRDGRTIVVVGGDGSLHAVANELYQRGELAGTVLGLVPLGTGNDLARGVGLPLDPADGARAVLNGTPRRLDLIVDDWGSVAVNAVNVGIGARASEKAAPLKPRLGRFGYAVGALIAGLRESGWRLRVEVDGRAITDGSRGLLQVVIANGPSLGGGTEAAPNADPSDGLADVVVSYAVGPLSRVGYAAQLRRGDHVVRRDVRRALGREVLIAGEPFPWTVDGELGEPRRDGRWRVEPGAWQMILPPAGG